MNTTIYLLRHGQYESPEHILPYRLPGFHLSEEGKKTAQKLAEEFSRKNISAIYASPLERTMETATIVAGKREVITDDRLLEVRSAAQGKPEGFPESMGGWKIYETDWYKNAGGETLEAITARMDAFMKEKIIEHKGQEILVVSHGDPLMLYLRKRTPYIRMGEYVTLAFS